MKMGTTASPWRYDVAARLALQLPNLQRPAISVDLLEATIALKDLAQTRLGINQPAIPIETQQRSPFVTLADLHDAHSHPGFTMRQHSAHVEIPPVPRDATMSQLGRSINFEVNL